MESLVELFCDVDYFCQVFMLVLENHLLANRMIQRRRPQSLFVNEVVTILINFHKSHYRDFKAVGYKNSIPRDFHANMRINNPPVDVFGLVRPGTPLLNTGCDGKHRSFV